MSTCLHTVVQVTVILDRETRVLNHQFLPYLGGLLLRRLVADAVSIASASIEEANKP